MGHIVLGAPSLARFHLHERLLRVLRQRGHRVSVVCADPVQHTFWRHQDHATVTLPPAGAADDELGEALCGTRGAQRAQLAALAASAATWLAGEHADLVLLHQDRSAAAHALQFAARRAGCRVLWTGDGLLPHTMQIDERGLDGDASCGHRAAHEFRVVRGEPELLRACLANALAGGEPSALARATVRVPPWRERARAALATAPVVGLRRAFAALRAWRQALPTATPTATAWQTPDAPYVAVLLQACDDPRVTLDAGDAPDAPTLVRAAVAAAAAIDPGLRVVAIAPTTTRARTLAGVPLLPAHAAAELAATSLATITVNHALASVALLAGTPVLHFGRALYGVRGVATLTTCDRLGDDLAQALAHDYPTLRERFLSWLFAHGHLWCSATHPDHNGLLGFVAAIEARLAEPTSARPALRHRKGPAWPLTGPPRP